jgi:hypothetical protein
MVPLARSSRPLKRKGIATARTERRWSDMPLQRVTRYAAAYNLKAKEYNFYYELEGQEGKMKEITLNSADDCVALCDLFRNESPIYYWPKQEYFITGREAVGEQELGNAVAEGRV